MRNIDFLKYISGLSEKGIIVGFKKKNRDINNSDHIKQFIIENIYNGPCIYSIVNIKNGRIYIGATDFFTKRKKTTFG